MDPRASVEAVWRIESARIVSTLARLTGDFAAAEDLAQEALAEALETWPRDGVPASPGAWLVTVARRRAIDAWRRQERLDERHALLARDLETVTEDEWEPIHDDVLRLVFTACHPVLSRESQVALTLRVVAGMTSEEVARAFLVPVATIQARITRAKKTLAAAGVPFATPEPDEWRPRLSAVLAVVYSVFTEGYAATSGDRWLKPEVAREALRLGRSLAALLPREPEVHGLVALMELQAARFPARVAADGTPVLLPDQDRSRWDRSAIRRGRDALAVVDRLGRGRGPYALQASIAEVHALAPRYEDTDWERIVLLYDTLATLAPSPVVELNRAVAVSIATGPGTALMTVDRLLASGALRDSHLAHSVRADLLDRLDRPGEAATAFRTAAGLAANERERATLLERAVAAEARAAPL